MKPNRSSLALTLMVMALLLTHTSGTFAQESAQVTKKPKPPSLWVLNETYGYDISIFAAAQLSRKTGTVAASGIGANEGRTTAFTFDSSGALWLGVCNPNGDSSFIADLTPIALRHLVLYGSASYGAVIQDPNKTGNPQYLSCALGMAFDPLGNLWVEVNPTGSEKMPTLIEYKSAQLVTGRPTPSAVIEMPTLTSEPVDLVFDNAGNLWQAAGGSVFEFTAAQLSAGAQADPYKTLDIDEVSPGLSHPQAIAFDSSHNLWVAFGLGGSSGNFGGLEMFAGGALGGSGTVAPDPVVTIDASTVVYHASRVKSYNFTSFNSPAALAFDSEGDLWVGNSLQPVAAFGAGSLVEFTPSQLGASGSPQPERAILANRHDTNLGSPRYLTFGPALP
jgi:hypothetical protein